MVIRDDARRIFSRTDESTRKKTVMIVEDDPTLRSLGEVRLKNAGCEVIPVHDGQAAIEEFTSGKIPDLVLLDIMMPRMDGFEVLDLIAANPLWAEIPVIVLSHLSEKSDIDLALEKGAKEFLIKSHFTLSEVLEKIHKYID